MRCLLLLLAACEGSPITTRTLEDVGTACLEDDQVTVLFDGCLSSSCDTLTEATCTATLEGTVVVVHATATVETQGTECTDDCGSITASCAAPDLTGAATISYAEEETSLAEAVCEII